MANCCEFKYNRFTQIQGGGGAVEIADNLWEKQFMFSGTASPLRNTTYYCGPNYTGGLLVNPNYTLMTNVIETAALKVVAATADIAVTGTLGTSEVCDLYVYNDTLATECQILEFYFDSTDGSYTADGLDCTIGIGEEWCLIFKTPNMVTQPTSALITFTILLEIQ